MWKKTLFFFAILLLVTGTAGAQWGYQQPGVQQYDQVEQGEAALGIQAGILSLNLEDLNEQLPQFENFEEEMMFYGAGGLVGLGRHRLGGQGMMGSQTAAGTEQGFKEARLELSYGGIYYENIILSGEHADLALGSLAGLGGANLIVRHEDTEDFEDGITEPHGSYFRRRFAALEPRVNLHLDPGDMIRIDVTGGYLLTHDFSDDWDLLGQDVNDPVGNLHGPSLSVRLSIGY